MTIAEVPAPPPLPSVGDLNWGPQVNECMIWLYQQHVENMAAIEENRQTIAALTDQVTILQGQVTALGITNLDQDSRLAAVEARPDYIFDSSAWTYHNGTPPAPAGQVRLDTTTPIPATAMDIRMIDLDGADRSPWFKRLTTTSLIRITDWDDSTRWQRFRVTGSPTFDATNAVIPIAYVDSAGAIASNQKVDVGFLIDIRDMAASLLG